MPSPESCPRCRANLGNVSHLYMVETEVGKHVIDVNEAISMVAGRGSHLVGEDRLRELIAIRNDLLEEHVAHVDPHLPGIIGQLYGGQFLLDGGYRAVRCLREHLPFFARILTFDETVACLVDEPAITPQRAVREVKEMLRSNSGHIEADISLSGALIGVNAPQWLEEKIRSSLSHEDNARLRLIFHHLGKAIRTPGKKKPE